MCQQHQLIEVNSLSVREREVRTLLLIVVITLTVRSKELLSEGFFGLL